MPSVNEVPAQLSERGNGAAEYALPAPSKPPPRIAEPGVPAACTSAAPEKSTLCGAPAVGAVATALSTTTYGVGGGVNDFKVLVGSVGSEYPYRLTGP